MLNVCSTILLFRYWYAWTVPLLATVQFFDGRKVKVRSSIDQAGPKLPVWPRMTLNC